MSYLASEVFNTMLSIVSLCSSESSPCFNKPFYYPFIVYLCSIANAH